MKLVSNWKSVWKWYSTWIAGLASAIPVAWAYIPEDLKAYVPVEWMPIIVVVMFVSYLIGRLAEQE